MRTFLEGETYYVEHPTYGWDRAIEIDGALTDAEIREIRINLLLEQ